MNSSIEVTKFEPETTFENSIDEIKADRVKIITSLDVNKIFITSNKSYFSSEHINDHLMTWIVPQSRGKSPKFTKYLSSIHLKGNTQLQNLKMVGYS